MNTRLPLEIWRHIFRYVLPTKEVGYLRLGKTPYTIPLYFAEGEDPIIKEAVETMEYTRDLLFENSNTIYWELLLAHDLWTIGAKSTGHWGRWMGYAGAASELEDLQDEWEGAVQHLVLIIDTTIQMEDDYMTGDDGYEWSAVTNALTTVEDVLDSFPALKTLDFYLDFRSLTPQRWKWFDRIMRQFSALLFGNWVNLGQSPVLPQVPIVDDDGDVVKQVDWLEHVQVAGVKLGVFVRTAQMQRRESLVRYMNNRGVSNQLSWKTLVRFGGNHYHKLI